MVKKNGFVLIIVLCLSLVFFNCKKNKEDEKVDNQEIVSVSKSTASKLEYAEKQLDLLLSKAEAIDSIPRTVKGGKIKWINPTYDWTEGFFPGSCWMLYEVTNNDKWKKAGEKFQAKFENHKDLTNDHDLGFIFNCSYGNGYRLTKNEEFKNVMVTAAKSLITRFDAKVGALKSWDVDRGWQSERGWMFPVIIDNMMNLELLFEVSELTGDSIYKNIAIAHADTTMKNHFREDFSSYHVVDYDTTTGEVRGEYPAQGVSRESSWSRGQAWGTLCVHHVL
ncbi:glucuronyl hydrolase [Algibacter lectus]|uniref:Glucuronyl hydrolase n=1 Tax=Algibacter lectus TaxID=221126 RepID=A0A090X1W9_9FLAO|nr:glycoside hydrolase family 88 protein [Algibacter lectus]GAL82089.1 glucuronyl hydrolase [Algibacter lectus]